MKKIMFNDRYGLTKAVLEGKKTQTRRVIPKEFFSLTWDVRDNTFVYENADGDFIDIRNSKYCRYKLGEVVAVAQNYGDCGNMPDYDIDEDGYPIMPRRSGFFNKMFVRADLMPHQIRITAVRVERLQDISDEDCIKEGIFLDGGDDSYEPHFFYDYPNNQGNGFNTPREAYAALIDKVSGKGTWDKNPYVFVYDFELVK